MLRITDSSLVRTCQGVHRREFLRIGGLALGGLALPQLLRAKNRGGWSRTRRS